MGALAEAIVAFAQPLLDQTDGSDEQVNKAFTMTQLCYNLALLPEDGRETMLSELRPSLKMDDEEFDAFRRTVIDPMIRRHQKMFPRMHRPASTGLSQSVTALPAHSSTARSAERYPGADRYGPCPCHSGRKYKFCCGARGR